MTTGASQQAETHLKAGMAFVRNGDFAAAATSFRQAIAAEPRHGFAHNNLGAAMAALGRHEQAIESYRRALEIDPSYAQAHFNLGASLQALGRRDDAVDCFIRALQNDPGHVEAYYYLGLSHMASGRPNEALACYLRATDLSPGEAEVYAAMGTVLVQLRLVDAAVRAFETALSLNPELSAARANLMFWLARECDWDRLEAHRESLPRLGIDSDPVPPFTLLALEDHPQRHRARSEKFAEATYSHLRAFPAPLRPAARPERLRIGYFSADFYEHATMFLSARMFELHDRSRFSIHGYSYGRQEGGAIRQRVSRACDSFRDVKELSDEAIAKIVREDRIDVAVDLKGYTEHQRLGILAYRPAPIQATFLGYPGTLGAPFIDYLIADPIVVPPEQRSAYAEQLIYLPHTYQINDDSREVALTSGSRAEAGLPEEAFVFCCFNTTYKITPAEFSIWMDLLRRVDGSMLWLLAGSSTAEVNLRDAAGKRGVDPSRLIFAPMVKPALHLARLRHADLFLDTFNCNAHTTASDALWAGLPVLTKVGRGFAARVAASLLSAIGLQELITTTERGYAELALALAQDPARLAAIRAKLAANRQAMPLFDSELCTRHIEQAYDLAYSRFLVGEAPEDIHVAALSGREWRARNDSNVRPSDS